MHIPWSDLQLVLVVSEAGSLSAAAKKLRITQPTVSRRLAELEALLEEPLFARSVEGVTLTAFGERLVVPAKKMAESVADAERIAARADVTPKGVVRLTAAPGIASEVVVPFAAHLRDVLPDVRLEVIAAVRYVDLARGEADLALRSEPLDRPVKQRDLVCIASRTRPAVAYATKEYVAKLPRPCRLVDVDWIGWTPQLGHLTPNPQLAALIPGFRPVFTADDFLVQLRAAEAGVGAIVLEEQSPRASPPSVLVPIPISFGKLASSLHLVCARGALSIPRVRAVADLLVLELAKKIATKIAAPVNRSRRGVRAQPLDHRR